MAYQIKDSLSVQFTKAPAIAIAGPSGSGKTESAMRLARGFVGPGKKFLVIDTEEKRALYKKARYQPWDWVDFQPPFSPENCVEVLELGRNYAAVVLDSGSHEYSGPGGLQDIQEESLTRMAGNDFAKRDRLSAASWKDAKTRHKTKLMSYLIRYPTLLIICLRAEPKVKFVTVPLPDGKKKTEIVDAGYMPICEKQFMFEMLVGAMMTADRAGIPQHVKQLEPELEPVFLADKQIDEATGQRLAAWCAAKAETQAPTTSALTKDQVDALVDLMNNATTEPELKLAFEAGWKTASAARDAAARERLRSVYDLRKEDILSTQKQADPIPF